MEHEKSPSDGLAYFAFNSDKEEPTDSWTCLRSLITQLCEDDEKLPFTIQNSDIRHCINGRRADRSVLLEALELLVIRQPRTFIIIDAIEKSSDGKEVVELLLSLAKKRLYSLHLLLTSRPELHIQKALYPLVTVTVGIEAQHPDEEIWPYVQEYLENSPRWKRLGNAEKRDIEDWLVHEADGK